MAEKVNTESQRKKLVVTDRGARPLRRVSLRRMAPAVVEASATLSTSLRRSRREDTRTGAVEPAEDPQIIARSDDQDPPRRVEPPLPGHGALQTDEEVPAGEAATPPKPPEKIPPAPPSPDDGEPERRRLSTERVAVTLPEVIQRFNDAMVRGDENVRRDVERQPGEVTELPDDDVLEEIFKGPQMVDPRRRAKWNFFVGNIGEGVWKPPQDRNIVVLLPQCRDGVIARTAESYFGGGSYDSVNQHVEIYGVDSSPLAINDANEYSSRPDPDETLGRSLPPNYAFINANPTNLDDIFGTSFKADVVLVDNPDLEMALDIWRPTLEQSFSMLDANGIMIITNRTAADQYNAAVILEALGAEFVNDTGVNLESQYLSNPDLPDDAFFIIARNRKQQETEMTGNPGNHENSDSSEDETVPPIETMDVLNEIRRPFPNPAEVSLHHEELLGAGVELHTLVQDILDSTDKTKIKQLKGPKTNTVLNTQRGVVLELPGDIYAMVHTQEERLSTPFEHILFFEKVGDEQFKPLCEYWTTQDVLVEREDYDRPRNGGHPEPEAHISPQIDVRNGGRGPVIGAEINDLRTLLLEHATPTDYPLFNVNQ